jgi:hypothetical protein
VFEDYPDEGRIFDAADDPQGAPASGCVDGQSVLVVSISPSRSGDQPD